MMGTLGHNIKRATCVCVVLLLGKNDYTSLNNNIAS